MEAAPNWSTTIRTPEDLRRLSETQLRAVADELRAETIDAVSVTGGHLGAGLGVATAVVYGAMVLIASLPGALVLVAAWVPRAAIAQTDGPADA